MMHRYFATNQYQVYKLFFLHVFKNRHHIKTLSLVKLPAFNGYFYGQVKTKLVLSLNIYLSTGNSVTSKNSITQ